MGFFDLNIPLSEPSAAAAKAARVKLATAAMELGYSGVAYNRAIKGVMSDSDRCTVTPLTLASLLNLSPALSSSVQFHRDRLGVPRAAPFRQYTRLTVAVDSLAQALALNSGNPVLKTYDIVSVRPLNQTAFDHACQRSEVDIIAIDFSEKLPFRLKLPMVKTAIQRGVYFEITYSGLIADIRLRRQIIANAKLLVDWTRGKNLIISSAASTVYELRGPYDVANLSCLLGLSMERAKAAVSKNCRALLTNALRKKRFHKEAVKVELISPGEQVEFDKPWPSDLLKWDPLSSGEGDLLLEDLAKAFAATSKVSKNFKAIDFATIIDSNRSHGFQLKDLISGDKVLSESQSIDNGKNANFITTATEFSVSSGGDFLRTDGPDLPEAAPTSMCENPFKQQASGNQNSRILYPCEFMKVFSDAVEIGGSNTTMEDERNKNLTQSTVNVDLKSISIRDWQLRKCANKNKSHVSLPNERLTESDMLLDSTPGVESKREQTCTPTMTELGTDMVLDSSPGGGVDSKREHSCTPTKDRDPPFPIEEKNLRTEAAITQEATGNPMDEDSTCLDIKDRDKSSPLPENSTEDGQLKELQNDLLQDHIPIQESNTVTIEFNSSVANDERQNATTEDRQHEIAGSQSNLVTLVQSQPGKSKAKRKKPRRQALLFPLKLKYNPSSFKKPHKRKMKTKMT